MPYSNREKQLAAQRKHYRDNKQKYILNLHEKRRRYKREFLEFLFEQKCLKCNEDHPACLEFHHRNPDDKEYQISANAGLIPFRTLLKEIKKCDILCANCHRKLHSEKDEFYKDEEKKKVEDFLDTLFNRELSQSGRVGRLDRFCCRFKSCIPDQLKKEEIHKKFF